MTEQASSPKESTATKPKRARKVLRAVAMFFGALGVALVIYGVAQLMLKRPRPPALFTEMDLPALPSPNDNGYLILHNEWRAKGEPKRPEKEVAEICDAKAGIEDRWGRAEGRAQKLSDAAHDAANWISLADRALSQPRFVDACPIQLENTCPRGITLLTLHQLQEATILHDALSERWADAFARTAKVVRADVDFLPSGRSAITQAVSMANMHRSLKLVTMLLDGVAVQRNVGKGPDATLVSGFAREMDDTFARIKIEDMDPMHAVVAEYLLSLNALDVTFGPDSGQHGPIAAVIYDPGHTMEMLNGRFEQIVAFARTGGVGSVPRYQRHPTWFLRNPVGHRVIEVLRPVLAERIPIIEQDRKEILKSRDELHGRLAGLMVSQ